MILIETERLLIKVLEAADKKYFTELFSDARILELIPQLPYNEAQIDERFSNNLGLSINDVKTKRCTCAIFEKNNPDMIGLALFLNNEAQEQELGYRFREKHWGKGYATETTKGMLAFYFTVLKVDKITADANIKNIGSIKILSKFMKPVKEYFNERDNCTDRRFEILKEEWLLKS